MQEITATLFALIMFMMVCVIMSYGIGFMFGGHASGMKVIAWEGKYLARFGRWCARSIFAGIESLAGWAKSRF